MRNNRPIYNGTFIHDFLDQSAAEFPDSPAVRDSTGIWTYHELDTISHAVDRWLAGHNVGPGTRVVVQAPTDRRLAALFFGVSRHGAVFVPLNPAMKSFHLRSVLENADPALVIIESAGGKPDAVRALTGAPVHDFEAVWDEVTELASRRARVAVPSEINPSDLAALVYTSGSTAEPKAVICPHAQVCFATVALVEALDYRPDDVVFCRFPMSWDYGLYKLLMTCAVGAELVFADAGADLRLVDQFRKTRATVVPIVPSLANMIIASAQRQAEPTRGVRLFTNTGAALPAATIDALRTHFPGAQVVRQFGQTECKRISVMPPEEERERPDSVGRPLPGTVVHILDADGNPVPTGTTGEIVVTGPHVMPGYWRNPEVTAKTFRLDPETGERRLHTGDYGHLDEDGYLYFDGRRDDMFKRKGIRMSTVEIEAAALDIAGVRAAAALPPDGEHDLAIFVEAADGAELEPHAVLRELAARLEPAKVPAICRVIPEIPRSAHGKYARDRLRDMHAREARPAAPRPREPLADSVPTDAARQAEPLRTPPKITREELVRRFGSPLYVYDLDRVTAAHRDLAEFMPEGTTIYYALKANPHPDVAGALRTAAGGGCRAEISSTGELAAALAAGFTGADCLYTGPGKTAGELAEALAAGVRLFSVESLTDLQHVGAAATAQGTVAKCLLRVNSATAAAATSIRMTGTPSQFGNDMEELPAQVAAMRAVAGTRIIGAHFFPLSNAAEEDSLLGEFQHTVTVAAEVQRILGEPLELVDLGGGFSAPYGVPGTRSAYPNLRKGLEEALDKYLPQWRDGRPGIACESGRYLVSDCGELHCSVVNVKESRGRTFVILDAGINAFGGMSGLGRLLPVQVKPASPNGGTTHDAVPGRRAALAGPLCTPGDLLAREVELPDPAPGDLVTIPHAGAYGLTASLSLFLGRPAPTEVVIRGDEIVSVSRLQRQRVYDPPRNPDPRSA
ncbi:AMP-binding protein [Sphaerisporangium sp. NPDC005288]|uniref:AMP-binding protein n=1 Tax=Sphaerisporangium sp. NPDC005288 TaxID=3155114 RepID=UPI0033B370A7